MGRPSIFLAHCPEARTYRHAVTGEDILPERFVERVMDELPPRATLAVSDEQVAGALGIRSTDLGWREIVLAPEALRLRRLLAPELERSMDFQLWLHARHAMPTALAGLLERAAAGAEELWLLLAPEPPSREWP